MPADLTAPLSKHNAVLVTKSTRRGLLDKLRRARKALSVRNAQAPNAAAQAAQQVSQQAEQQVSQQAEQQVSQQASQQVSQQKQLAFLWHRSIKAVTLLPLRDDKIESRLRG